MPRKVDSGFDYDDDYDVYEDYDCDYDYADDYEVEEKGTAPGTKDKQKIGIIGVWRCPICTFDNEDSMSACDICGVLRDPLVKINTDSHTAAAPFKFNAPSPDDLVSNGLRSMKLKSRGNVLSEQETNILVEPELASERSLSSERETNIPVESELAIEGPESSSASGTGDKHNGVNEEGYASGSRNESGKSIVVNEEDSALGSGNEPELFDSSMSSPTLSSRSGKTEITSEGKTASISQYNPDSWMIPNKEDDELTQLNLAIVGHVDSGKSTLSGRLLHLLGQISQKDMHKYQKEAKQLGKGSFAYAWALDESAEERERGITMTVGVAFFTSKKYHVVLLDSPGHRDFVPKMISGATQADAAIIVVDASMGSFEAGIDATRGQTREHAQLVRSFGVDQIIVVVNKMDAVGYSKERFDVVKQKLGTFLRSYGFKDSSVVWIPASAMENQNLIARPSDAQLSWFKGPSLLDAIDSLKLPARDYTKPLLMPICDVMKSQSQGQVSVCGKLESGAIRTGFKVLAMPSREVVVARSLEKDAQQCKIARAGDSVTVHLQGIEGNSVRAGGVICHPDYPVKVSNHLELKILVLDISTPILIGSQLEFHIHHAKEAARIVKISSLLDPKTGKTTKKSPRCLVAKQNAIVEVVLQEAVCVEEYSNCRALGRVFLRASGRTVGLGIVTKIFNKMED
ncbi:elongation factor 1 alpha [Handroanthus impetiginosus]|uniref:Elongation factor 1 alpha n=1 Tax=Handroanthus impetiginosus TaxID=429701 RepID=A0A2G9GZL2_9LAMI|nr:elongation factor 1 alpha [Handroanthus impetiginosus]